METTLKGTLQRLSHSQQQRDRAQSELKRVAAELRETRERCARVEKDKLRSETILKTQVKSLLARIAQGTQYARELRSTSSSAGNGGRTTAAQNGRRMRKEQSVSISVTTGGKKRGAQATKRRSPMRAQRSVVEKTKRASQDIELSPNPIARSLDYFVKNTPLRPSVTDKKSSVRGPDDEGIPEEYSTNSHGSDEISRDLSAERIVRALGAEFAHREEEQDELSAGIDEYDHESVLSKDEAIPVPRSSVKNVSMFSCHVCGGEDLDN